MNNHQHNTGFTLIEMLVALAMMAMIASMVYGSYAATSQSMAAYDSRLTCAERASLVLRLMARQIHGVYAPLVDSNNNPSVNTTGRGKFQADVPRTNGVSFEHLRPIFQGDAQQPRGEILSFATTAGRAGGTNGLQGLSQVRYRYDSITNTLWINCGPHLAPSGRGDFAQRGYAILDHVAAIDLAFYDGQRWLTEWSGTKSRELPRAVRIDLHLLDDDGRSYDFGTTVRVFCRTAHTPLAGPYRSEDRR